MTEQTKATLATITIVAGLALIGYLAFLRVDGAGMAAVGIVVALVSWFTRTPDRKDPPGGATIVPLVAAGALLAALVACGSSEAKSVQADSAYTTELAKCTHDSKTLAESILCEKKVDAKWHITTKETAR